jgi:hypothetical protein
VEALRLQLEIAKINLEAEKVKASGAGAVSPTSAVLSPTSASALEEVLGLFSIEWDASKLDKLEAIKEKAKHVNYGVVSGGLGALGWLWCLMVLVCCTQFHENLFVKARSKGVTIINANTTFNLSMPSAIYSKRGGDMSIAQLSEERYGIFCDFCDAVKALIELQ